MTNGLNHTRVVSATRSAIRHLPLILALIFSGQFSTLAAAPQFIVKNSQPVQVHVFGPPRDMHPERELQRPAPLMPRQKRKCLP